jgi:hypothetical protein
MSLNQLIVIISRCLKERFASDPIMLKECLEFIDEFEGIEKNGCDILEFQVGFR